MNDHIEAIELLRDITMGRTLSDVQMKRARQLIARHTPGSETWQGEHYSTMDQFRVDL